MKAARKTDTLTSKHSTDDGFDAHFATCNANLDSVKVPSLFSGMRQQLPLHKVSALVTWVL